MPPGVLVTGFGPFPGAPENPSQILLEELRRKHGSSGDCELHLAVLPTRYDAGREELLRLHRRLRPDIAIHFGFSLKAEGFTLERLAQNRVVPGRRDAAGARPARSTLRQGGPLACRGTLPLAEIHAALASRGIEVCFSDDAGGYVCNLVFYEAARRALPPRMSGFIHIPLIADMKVRPSQRGRAGRALPSLSRADLLEGARLILATCAAEWRRRGPAVPQPNMKKGRLPGGKRPKSREEMPKEGHGGHIA